jgi:hypothetical protein
VTGSRSRAWLCFKGTEEGEEEDGLFLKTDARAIKSCGKVDSLSLSCFSVAAGFVHSYAAWLSHRSYHVMV